MSKHCSPAFESEGLRMAILAAVRKANELCQKWSGGNWLIDSDTEGIMRTAIAEAVFDQVASDGFVLFEPTPWAISLGCGWMSPYQSGEDGERFDLVVVDSERQPIYIIEAKRQWGNQVLKDIGRIVKYQSMWGPSRRGRLRGGFAAFMVGTTLKPAAWTLQKRKARVVRAAASTLPSSALHFSQTWSTQCSTYTRSGREREGVALCIEVDEGTKVETLALR